MSATERKWQDFQEFARREQIERTRRECELIPHFAMRRTGEPPAVRWASGQGWYWDFAHNVITMDEKDLVEKPPVYAKAVALHETAHTVLSQPQLLADIWKEPGAGLGYNWIEDDRIENFAPRMRSDGKELIKGHLDIDVAPGGGLDYKGIKAETARKLGHIPKHMMFGAAMREYFYLKELCGKLHTRAEINQFINEIPDESVREAFRRIRVDVERYYQQLPSSGFDPQVEFDAAAERSTQIFKDKIWPEYKKLVAESREDQSLAEFLEEFMDAAGGGGAIVMVPMDALPQDVQEEINEKMKQHQQEQQAGAQQGQSGKDQQQSGKGHQSGQSGQPGGQQSGQGQSQSGGGESQSGSFGQGKKGNDSKDGSAPQGTSTSGEGKGQGEGDSHIPWDTLSDRAKKAAQKAFDRLPKYEQERYKAEAEQAMGELEDEVNDKLRGHSNDEKSSMGTDFSNQGGKGSAQGQGGVDEDDSQSGEDNRSEGSYRPQSSLSPEQKQLIEDKMKQLFDTLPANAWDKSRANPIIDKAIDELKFRLKPVFKPNLRPKVIRSEYGDELDVDMLLDRRFDRGIRDIFTKESVPKSKSYRMLLLVDISPSMDDKKHQVFGLVQVIAEVNAWLGIETAVLGYPVRSGKSVAGIFQDFEDVSVKQQYLPDEVKSQLTGLLNSGGGSTPTMAATQAASRYLVDRNAVSKKEHNFFITITDGDPTDCSVDQILQLNKEMVRQLRGLQVVGFGLGRGTEQVTRAYPPMPIALKEKLKLVYGATSNATQYGNRSLNSASEPSYCFEDMGQFVSAVPLIFEYMLLYPDQFK